MKELDERWETIKRKGSIAIKPVVGSVFGDSEVVWSIYAEGKVSGRVGFLCSCGESFDIQTHRLRGSVPQTKCRACSYSEKGKSMRVKGWAIKDHALLVMWRRKYTAMVKRCYDKRDPAFNDYGGRGINVHRGWLIDRNEFFKYATTLDGWDNTSLQIDRRDNDGNYEPGNIRMVSASCNSRNKRTTRIVNYVGCDMSCAEFSERFLPDWERSKVYYQLNKGLSPESIVELYAIQALEETVDNE